MNRLAALFLAFAPLAAQADEAAITSAKAVINSTVQALDDGELTPWLDNTPPALVQEWVKEAGVSKEQFYANTLANAKEALKTQTIELARIVPGSMALKETTTGRAYVDARLEIYHRDSEYRLLYRHVSPVIAFEEEGQWYFSVIESDRELMRLHRAYPDFEGEEIVTIRVTNRVLDNKLPDDLQQ